MVKIWILISWKFDFTIVGMVQILYNVDGNLEPKRPTCETSSDFTKSGEIGPPKVGTKLDYRYVQRVKKLEIFRVQLKTCFFKQKKSCLSLFEETSGVFYSRAPQKMALLAIGV